MVGTVILFGFLIVALGIFQIQVVPTENANVEFEHSQQVEDDFGDLRNDVLRAGSTGSTGSTQVRLGTRYPARTFFINPPPVSGSLETEPTGPIRVLNATVGDGAHQNARDFWNTSPSFETRSLRYDAEYNEFDGAPELVYEHSVVAAEFDDAVLLRTGQTVVSEERISLTALTGSVSETGVVPRSVDPRAVSASDTTVPLEPRGGQITLELPTAIGNASALADRWNGALPAGATATPNATGEALRVTLDNTSDDRPYRLALSEVSLDASGETEPAYVVPVGPQNVALDDTVTVEVRDRYNNPVPDATVSIVGDGRENTTNDDGRVFFEANRTSITATINGTDAQPFEDVSFDASADAPTTGVNRIYEVEWDEFDPVPIEEGTTDGELDILVSDADSDAPIDNAAVDVALTPLGNVNGIPSFDEPSETDADGRTTVRNFNTNGANAGDNFTFYASAGDDVDVTRVTVVENTGTGSEADAAQAVDGTGSTTGSGNSGKLRFDITADSDISINAAAIRTTGSLSSVGADSESKFTIRGEPSDPAGSTDGSFDYTFNPSVVVGPSDGDTEVRFDKLDTGIENISMVNSEANADIVVALQFDDGSVKQFFFQADERQPGPPN
ncbi:hypothetical protein PM035_05845 [Halorubrum ezzemoulense]|uniref:hypothetical protein n=1 Tax=Halorubrum ezzemoulense TaxID=337243 RepID=UPI00232A9983|nr:hypothetical protein [Halorubrum ezzemoulense]MDB2260383.1 hypothetical protein [Halorubrum ezzemoulense]MDB2267224.1 hypothetical protein [Halorubrum ezzemoulense]